MPLPAQYCRPAQTIVKMLMAPQFVIARALCARGNLGKALTYSPMAPQLSSHVLRDSHVASLLGMTTLEPLRVRRCRSLHEPIRKKTRPQACARKRVILKIAILRHLSNRIGQQNRRHSASAECRCLFLGRNTLFLRSVWQG